MKPLDRATIAEIAARYAAGITPDLRAVVVPQGVSGVPYPFWREAGGGLREGLYDPAEGKAYRARMWSHMPKRPKKPVDPITVKGVSKERAEKLRHLHSLGLTNAEIAKAGGGTYESVKKAIRLLGLYSNRK